MSRAIKQSVEISEYEHEQLERLYREDGAWTIDEAKQYLASDRIKQFFKVGILLVQVTEMGAVCLLGTSGRAAVFQYRSGCVNLDSQVNTAYRRLAIQQLGWCVLQNDELGFEVPETLRSRSFVFCRTGNGLALVGGQLTGNGFSTAYLRKLVQKYRSTALLHGFEVVILMPHQRRGHALAARFPGVLQVISILPDTGSGKRFDRLTRPPVSLDNRTPEGPYLAGEAWRNDPEMSALPALVQQILQLSRTDRVSQAIAALKCDGVMTAAQLKRFYALQPEDLPQVYQMPTTLCPVPTRLATEVRVTFLTLHKRLANKSNPVLCHRCGTGHMRHLLSLPPDPERYSLEPRSKLKYEEPDAIWTSSVGQQYALEYDHGTYSWLTIQRKLDTFRDRDFAGIIWGVGSPLRQRNLQAKIGKNLQQPVLLVEWWR